MKRAGVGSTRARASRVVRATALVGAFCGCTAGEREVSWDRAAAPIVQGQIDTGDPAVVAIVARRTQCDSPEPSLLCTGTLVAPRVVLTAAHCFDTFGPQGAYEIAIGPSTTAPETRFVVAARVAVHPGYNRVSRAMDAALVLLAEDPGIAPVRLASRAPGMDEVGSAVRVVGYGDTRQEGSPSGVKREGAMVWRSIEATAITAAAAPSNSCQGDSGGPVFATRDGVEELVGVTNRGDPGCRRDAVALRVDVVREYIDSFVREAAGVAVVGAPVLAGDELCGNDCARDEECPAGFQCVTGSPGTPGRCSLGALEAGRFGAACARDGECGASGLCARLWPSGDGACRCYVPCVDVGMPGVDAGGPREATTLGGGGCSVGLGRSARGGGIAVLMVAAVLGARARRGRGRRGRRRALA